MPADRVTVDALRHWPAGKPLLALTAYDYPTARHLDEAGVDILHVGDSLGMVALGFEDTTFVTMEDMLRATGAVARARRSALITADLPYRAYETPEQALSNSRALVDAGADAVKMEGGSEILPQIRAVLEAGIAVQGHLGMLPQHIREEGAYKKKGKGDAEAAVLVDEACALEAAGVFSLVLESVVAAVAGRITAAVRVPTLGIASGAQTTGQIRVVTDLVGMTPWYDFPHIVAEGDVAGEMRQAVARFRARMAG